MALGLLLLNMFMVIIKMYAIPDDPSLQRKRGENIYTFILTSYSVKEQIGGMEN